VFVSPQFGSRSVFAVDVPGYHVRTVSGRSNAFVENVLSYALAYLGVGAGRGLGVAVLGDNGFYSQRGQLEKRGLEVTMENLASLPPFLPFLDPSDQPKTGLGSSAALVTSLCAALAAHPSLSSAGSPALDLSTEQGRARVHNLAQLAHCAAQGKIGSGFDVCAAVYGTLEYTRFSPSILEGAIAQPVPVEAVRQVVNGSSWDHVAAPFALPEGLVLMVGDVASGACTPVMVSKLLAWKKADEGGRASPLWAALVQAHTAVARSLQDKDQWRGALRGLYESLRETVRQVSRDSGVPVEPETLTPLLDATRDVPGCVIAGCPGAGGEDAIFALVHGQQALRDVEMLWRGWKDNSLNKAGINVCALDVKDGDGGVRIESHLKGDVMLEWA
jgi:phosphomevalonate kinase